MKSDIQKDLLGLMRAPSYTPLTLPQIAAALGLPRKSAPKLRKAMDSLLADGRAAKVKGDRYGVPDDLNLVAGVVAFRQGGGAFLDVPDSEGSIETARGHGGGAQRRQGACADAAGFLQAAQGQGRAQGLGFSAPRPPAARKSYGFSNAQTTKLSAPSRRSYGFWHVVPDDPKFFYDVIVADPSKSSVTPPPKENDKVVAKLNEWAQRHMNPTGEIVENLGESHTPMAEYRAILVKYNLSETFPEAVEREAEGVPESVGARDISGRFDARGIMTITIDPEDAKDFDDAISVRALPGGLSRGRRPHRRRVEIRQARERARPRGRAPGETPRIL